ncbi:chromatin accessibility complex protein 1 [Ornithorhynchus anatinus]|uniref:Chromatin accessibility complex protein 1 n=1 Tax=Ornithorhynchus anatinus TaxID=9258 RepID=A0A6I8P0R1_ORNAN|nr:chromatin accessibility complex protein 1 [Ornithorhynchus anatinus]
MAGEAAGPGWPPPRHDDDDDDDYPGSSLEGSTRAGPNYNSQKAKRRAAPPSMNFISGRRPRTRQARTGQDGPGRAGAGGGKMADGLGGKGERLAAQRLVSLPLSRIRVIMKSSPEVSSINQEALVLTAKATELFVQYLATYSYKHGSGKEKKSLTYSDLSNTAEESETFQFLSDILPKKILASKYLKMLKEEKRGEGEEEEDEDSEDEEAES